VAIASSKSLVGEVLPFPSDLGAQAGPDRIAKAYPTMLAGPAIALLDPNWHPGLPAPGATPPPAAPAPGKR